MNAVIILNTGVGPPIARKRNCLLWKIKTNLKPYGISNFG